MKKSSETLNESKNTQTLSMATAPLVTFISLAKLLALFPIIPAAFLRENTELSQQRHSLSRRHERNPIHSLRRSHPPPSLFQSAILSISNSSRTAMNPLNGSAFAVCGSIEHEVCKRSVIAVGFWFHLLLVIIPQCLLHANTTVQIVYRVLLFHVSGKAVKCVSKQTRVLSLNCEIIASRF